MELFLSVEPPGGETLVHHCKESSLVIGRSSAADLTVGGDRSLSKRHARLFYEGDEWLVEDLGSRNGTILNGRPVEAPTRVAPGDTILISDCVIRIEESGEPSPQPETRADDARNGSDTLFRPAETILSASTSLERSQEAQEIHRHATRLKLLNEVHKALATSIASDELLSMILDRVFALLRPEEAVIFLENDEGDYYRAMSRRLPRLKDEEYFYSRSLVREVSTKRLAALVVDAQQDELLGGAESVVSSGVRSLLAAPLLHSQGCPGMIVLASRVNVRQFSEDDMELLVSLASVAALQLRHIELAEEAAKRKELEKELALARHIQMALLPEAPPDIDGYSIFASNFPSRTVSGDLYRFEARENGTECHVFLADVSGKGMAASLLTASLEALAAGPMEMGREPDDMFEKLSRRLYQRTPLEKYATAFVAVLRSMSGSVQYANAGHNPALVVRASGTVEELGANGVPLGLLPVAEYTKGELTLGAGDSLVVYTDGLTEAENPAGEEFEIERLKEVCLRERARTADEMAAAVAESIETFADGTPYGDDRTLVIVRRTR